MSIKLTTKGCPGEGCSTDVNRIIYWNAYLDKNGNVFCNKCNSKYSILEAKFKCKDCQQYRECNKLKIIRLLSSLSSMEFDHIRSKICNFSRVELANFIDDVTDSLYDPSSNYISGSCNHEGILEKI